jgi:hypothetical protein|tara:strand:+ start:284 stop:499 length:216 start_codon:yes stop_codon:yes gene_type:complete
MTLNELFNQTDWRQFESQKNMLVDCCESHPELHGLVNFIDHLQDAIVSEKMLTNSVVFPSTYDTDSKIKGS